MSVISELADRINALPASTEFNHTIGNENKELGYPQLKCAPASLNLLLRYGHIKIVGSDYQEKINVIGKRSRTRMNIYAADKYIVLSSAPSTVKAKIVQTTRHVFPLSQIWTGLASI